jgi:hypothetical protein
VDKDAKISSDKSLSRKEYQEEAKQLMNAIQAKNDVNRAISIVLEFAVGKVHTTFQKMASLPSNTSDHLLLHVNVSLLY